ncbi:hypothetical protein WNZ14_20480 [Hoeflea sp. AS60]|uniref:hypothetical protein n=1 Tax=Hoeflea sp. AS60 TaxID=3135780 RepID=UPI003172885D
MPLKKILKKVSSSRLLSWSKTVCVAGTLVAGSTGSGLALPDCKRLILAEYCFDGAIKGLFPLRELEEAFAEEAAAQKKRRLRQSRIPEREKQWLVQEWEAATTSAFTYAKNHTLTLEQLLDTTDIPSGGPGPLNILSGLLAQGPLFRLTFANNGDDIFMLFRPVELNRVRLTSALKRVSAQLPQSSQVSILAIQSILSSLPGGDYIEVKRILDHPIVIAMLLALNNGKPLNEVQKKLIGQYSLGLFGLEAVMVFYTQFDLRLRERNEQLDATVQLFEIGDAPGDLRSPQVTFNGELLMPDSVFDEFTKDEILLILQHEATHLAKPGTFTVFSAADGVIANRFPQISPDHITTYLSNVFGRSNPAIKDTSCPLDLPEDDEMFTDYYVMAQYRNDSKKMDAYEALLQKLHKMRGFGSLSRMAYRRKHLTYVRQQLEEMRSNSVSEQQYNEAMSKVLQDVISSAVTSGTTVEQLNLDLFLDEMMKYPDLQLDAKRLRVFIQYYKTYGHLKDEQVGQNGTLGLSCNALERMLKLPEKG